MVECTGLENQQSRKVLVGSNPTASATVLLLRLAPSTLGIGSRYLRYSCAVSFLLLLPTRPCS